MHVWFVQKTLEWRNCPKPTVALVHGYCIYAGWMLAAAMDVVFAAEDTLFLPGLVEYFSVPWDLSPRKAKEILLEHRFISAAEALAYGFVNRTYPADRLEEETLAYAGRVADNYLSAPAWTRDDQRPPSTTWRMPWGSPPKWRRPTRASASCTAWAPTPRPSPRTAASPAPKSPAAFRTGPGLAQETQPP